jgi:hypothetical protein
MTSAERALNMQKITRPGDSFASSQAATSRTAMSQAASIG